jgi:glycosyltransferase involved in cell wall biosynthesis
MNKVYHLIFLGALNFLLAIAWIYSKFQSFTNKRKNDKKKILALPYYSLNYAGGHSRIGDWKPYFEKEGIAYEVHWASETKEFLDELINGSWQKKYWFYTKVLFRRFRLLFQLNNYDTVWIQRAYVPFFPFKDAYFEKIISHINSKIIIDFYDADYESNYKLTINAAKYANKVTVASQYLVNFFQRKNIAANYVRYAMNYDEYIPHTEQTKETIIIGWMGAPNNFRNVLLIEDELIKIEEQYPHVSFHFICREIMPVNLKRYKVSKWGDEGFNYHQTIATFDIGIAPMIHATERDKARTAFKTLEYMAAGVPFITSPWGTSDQLVDNHNCLFANNKEEWSLKIESLITDAQLRKRIGSEARKTLIGFHSYANVFEDLRKILVE